MNHFKFIEKLFKLKNICIIVLRRTFKFKKSNNIIVHHSTHLIFQLVN